MSISIPGYEVGRLLGSGGMAMVYLATDLKLNRKVALKVLLENLSVEDKIRRRFFQEAQVLASLTHPNIVTLYDYIEHKNRLALAMEFVEGKSLDELIGRETGPIPAEKALGIFSQVLDAVEYAHSKGVIHRDLKPSNVMLAHSGLVKVADFGIAKIAGLHGLTHTGARKPGSLHYMPPEAIHGEESSIVSDIYSLGMTLYEMLAGAAPLEKLADSELKTMVAITEGRIPDPREFYPHIPKHLVGAIFKAIAVNPGDRFQSCAEFKHALSAQSAGNAAPVSFSATTSIGRKSRFSLRKTLAIGIPSALAVAAALLLTQSGPDHDPFQNSRPLAERTQTLFRDSSSVVFNFCDPLLTGVRVIHLTGSIVNVEVYDQNNYLIISEVITRGDSSMVALMGINEGYLLLQMVDKGGQATVAIAPQQSLADPETLESVNSDSLAETGVLEAKAIHVVTDEVVPNESPSLEEDLFAESASEELDGGVDYWSDTVNGYALSPSAPYIEAEGYDENGFDSQGVHRDTGTEFDPEGFDVLGYDAQGRDRDGIDMFGRPELGSI